MVLKCASEVSIQQKGIYQPNAHARLHLIHFYTTI